MRSRTSNQPARKLHPTPDDRRVPLLCFLHGFLGDPSDWDEVISFLPGFECLTPSYPFSIPDDALLIGYSMGGRIALRYPNPKIILSAHPGLATQQEKEAQKKKEQVWIDKLETLPFPAFLEAWYAQPLFESLRSHPRFPEIFARRLRGSPTSALQQLKQERLSAQPQLPTEKALFVYGEQDLKYASLYSSLNCCSHAIERSGHAIHLENPRACAALILERSGDLYRHQIPQTTRGCEDHHQPSEGAQCLSSSDRR